MDHGGVELKKNWATFPIPKNIQSKLSIHHIRDRTGLRIIVLGLRLHQQLAKTSWLYVM